MAEVTVILRSDINGWQSCIHARLRDEAELASRQQQQLTHGTGSRSLRIERACLSLWSLHRSSNGSSRIARAAVSVNGGAYLHQQQQLAHSCATTRSIVQQQRAQRASRAAISMNGGAYLHQQQQLTHSCETTLWIVQQQRRRRAPRAAMSKNGGACIATATAAHA
jgi:hypothetical protein